MFFLYNIAIYSYLFIIKFAGLFNNKAKLWVAGRKGLLKKIESNLDQTRPVVWFHCASLGEFEQGRPIIESFRKDYPDFIVFLTFFSPSGYEIRKNYSTADYIYYMPLDTRANVKAFIKTVNPKIAIFIKYEFWFNYIDILIKNSIPIFIVSGIFRKDQHFFKWYGGWFRKILMKISHFFVQTPSSKKLLQSININNVTVSGDTRFDRVYQVAEQKKPFPLIEIFAGNSKVIVVGSSWPEDENLIIKIINEEISDLKFIIAPHETDKNRINSLCDKLKNHHLKYSEANELNISQEKVLVIDSIGILSHLYQYGTIAYIGGGFGKDIHNILEAVTFGNPVIFGPKYKKFQEAVDLIDLGGAFSIKDGSELERIVLDLLQNRELYSDCSNICIEYISGKRGATTRILDTIKEYIPK